MSLKTNTLSPSVDVSGWESVLIHLYLGSTSSDKVTSDNIRTVINKDIAKMANQKQPVVDTQEKYDNKYIKAIFRRMKKQLDSVLSGTQEVEYHIDGAKSCFSAYAGTEIAHGNINNLDDLDKLLRDAIGEYKLKKLLDDVVAMDDDVNIHTNMVIHELKQNGLEDMIDNMPASSIMKYYDEWGGDYFMNCSWWQPYTERLLKMAIILHEIVLDYLSASENFDEDDLWAALDSDDITFMISFEYDDSAGDTNGFGELIDTRADLVRFIRLYFEKCG